MRRRRVFTPPCRIAAYSQRDGTSVPRERSMEHILLNVIVVVAFFHVVVVAIRLAGRI
jgi:hypothetical protein